MYYGKTKDERLQILRAINESVTLPGYEYSSKPVVVTSYEVSINDSKLLGKIKWDLLIVDEGHRIKNSNCRLIRSGDNHYVHIDGYLICITRSETFMQIFILS